MLKSILISIIFCETIALFGLTLEPSYQYQPPGDYRTGYSKENKNTSNPSTPTAIIKIQINTRNEDQDTKDDGYRNYIFEMGHKILHDPIALFTGLLSFTTFLLVIVTRRTYIHFGIIERAYISGGGWLDSGNHPAQFVLTIENNGKTPAYLYGYALFICDRNSLPSEPNYLRPEFPMTKYVDRISPGGIFKPITRRTSQTVPNPIAYGRFWYKDIWGKKHFFSFILPIRHPDDHSLVSDVSETYTAWD
jgi:hypothetical protein